MLDRGSIIVHNRLLILIWLVNRLNRLNWCQILRISRILINRWQILVWINWILELLIILLGYLIRLGLGSLIIVLEDWLVLMRTELHGLIRLLHRDHWDRSICLLLLLKSLTSSSKLISLHPRAYNRANNASTNATATANDSNGNDETSPPREIAPSYLDFHILVRSVKWYNYDHTVLILFDFNRPC